MGNCQVKKYLKKLISWLKRKSSQNELTFTEIQQINMPVPDNVIFGQTSDGKTATFGDVRAADNDTKIDLLRIRLTNILINQVQPLRNMGSPFPLAVMTCVGIEILGEIIFEEDKSDHGGQFTKVASMMHQGLARPFTKKFQKALKDMWQENKEIEKTNKVSLLLYRYFRNSMFHSYYAKGVYLSFEETSFFELKEDEGYLIINPIWLWDQFVSVFYKSFVEILANSNSGYRKQCLFYIEKLLK